MGHGARNSLRKKITKQAQGLIHADAGSQWKMRTSGVLEVGGLVSAAPAGTGVVSVGLLRQALKCLLDNNKKSAEIYRYFKVLGT